MRDWHVNVKRLAYLANDGGPIKVVKVSEGFRAVLDLVFCNGQDRDGELLITGSIIFAESSRMLRSCIAG